MAKTSTKRALLGSAVSLLLCFAMLLGTTFAWFTDNVTSTGNRILAGDLEIDLLMDKAENGTYTSIAGGSGDIFSEAGDGKWEPGKTQIVYLAVRNTGSLALKYNIILDIIDGGLIGSLEYAVIDGAKAADLSSATKWADIKAIANAQVGEVVAGKTVAAPNGKLDAIALTGEEDETDYFALAVHMKEEAGNQYENKNITIDVLVNATQVEAEEDSFGKDYDKDVEYPDATVYTAADLQAALDSATGDAIIALAGDITEDFELIQKPGVEIVIDGNGHDVEGSIIIDGKSSAIESAGVTIQNVNFKADTNGDFALVNLGDGTNTTRYTNNVTIKNCTFDAPASSDPKVVAIKSYTGGDKNLTISGCTVTSNMHSLVQVANVTNLVIENCEVYSKNGINVNQSPNVTISGCTVDTKGYTVRFGASSGAVGNVEKYLIKNSTLKSACDDGDAAIILRGTAESSTLTIENTTINATTEIDNKISATIVR